MIIFKCPAPIGSFPIKRNSRHAKLYTYYSKEKKWDKIELYGITTYPDGGLRSSINDISKYFQYFINTDLFFKERIISRVGIEGMFSPDYFNFYSNFWKIGNGKRDPEVSTRMYYK